jgi:SAM-dependent methyltransferase
MSVDMSGFDEAYYLTKYSDVADAVAKGVFASGYEHYRLCGALDGRVKHQGAQPGARANPLPWPFPSGAVPNRRDKILANLTLKSLEGLEIGALVSPLVRPSEGSIFYVDHADTETLKVKYSADPSIDVSQLVEVGAVWGSGTLEECVGSDRKLDYVVASHVVEHVPDLITWLEEIRSILRPNGTLRLAVPDRRYTFDYLRFESRVHDVLDAFLQKARAPLPRLIIEHCSLLRVIDCAAAWSGTLDTSNLQPYSSTKLGLEYAKDAISNGTYHDTHCWVFTPMSLAKLFVELAELDLLHFACEFHIETPRNEFEFYVAMAPSGDKAAIIASWLEMESSLANSPTYQKA